MVGGSYTRARLDSALAIALFPRAMVRHMHSVKSDHTPLFLVLEERDRVQRRDWLPKLFQYEKMWEEHEGFSDFVKHKWDSSRASNASELQAKIL